MGFYIDQKSYTKKEALDFLKISPSFIPQVRRKVIQCNVKQVDRDKFRPYKSYGGKPAYTIFVPHLEKEVEIRYALSPPRAHETIQNKLVFPNPRTLRLAPAEDGTMLIPDELEFLFWFLRPACEQSPFRDKMQPWYYSFKDDNAKATKDMEREEKYILAMSILVGPSAWKEHELKHLAKGMNIAGVDDMLPMVVKNELKKLAWKDPHDFYTRANSREVLFSGKIQEAIDAKVIQLRSLNGMQRWYIVEEEILPIAFGQDPLTELKSHMAEKWYLYSTKVEDGLKGVDLAQKLNNPINDAAFAGTPEPVTKRIRAELTPAELKLLDEFKDKDWFQAKMEKIDAYDKSDPDSMHPAQLKSWKDNEAVYNAWKKKKDNELAEAQEQE